MARLQVLWTGVAAFCLLYVGMAVLLYALQGRLVYQPDRYLVATPRDIGLAYQDITLVTDDGYRLHAWYLPSDAGHWTILFFHGNAGNISHRLDTLSIFHRLGVNVLIPDYRGYGLSEGTPTERGTYLDALAAWRYLVRRRGVPPAKIAVFGRSLGAAVATWLAAGHAPGALIVESAFTSLPDLAAKLYPLLPVRLLSRYQYHSRALITKVTCPVLVIHSEADEIVPIAHGRQLYANAPQPKTLLIIRGRHNDGFRVSEMHYLRGISTFLEAARRTTSDNFDGPHD